MRPHSFHGLLARALAAAGLVALGVAVPAGAAQASPAGGRMTLTRLSFPSQTVDATGGHGGATLTWAIRDTNPAASILSGDITVRMAGKTPGTFIGRAFDIEFGLPGGEVVNGTGTIAHSKFSYDFPVAQYSFATTASWVVTKVTAGDDQGDKLRLSGTALDKFGGVLTATELVDSTPPVPGSPAVLTAPALAYNGGGQTPSLEYGLQVQDSQSGFWKGRLTLTGPGGQTLHAGFTFVSELNEGFPGGSCGLTDTDEPDVNCIPLVSFPPSAAAGTWTVTAVTVWDNAGNHATTANLDAAPVIVSADQGMTAGDFTTSPSPVDDWGSDQTVTLTMSVSGAQDGVTSILVDFNDALQCQQRDTTPVQNPDGTWSASVIMTQGVPQCQVAGLAVTDGSGNAALYGSDFGAPDPGITLTRQPDTIPPTATSATLSPASVSVTQGGPEIVLAIDVTTPIAPVDRVAVTLLDSNGDVLASSSSLAFQRNGQVFATVPPPAGGLTPGTYTVAFTLTDAGGLTASYGFPGGPQLPGGPLLLTVTS